MESIPLGDWSLSKNGRLRISFMLPNAKTERSVRIIIAQREDGSGEYDAEAPCIRNYFGAQPDNGNRGVYKADIDLTSCQWHEARWDIVVEVNPDGAAGKDGSAGGSEQLYELKASKKQRQHLYRTATQAYLPGNAIVIPYLSSRRCLDLIYRERTPYDAPSYLRKELLAMAVYRLRKDSFRKRGIWLVYEKQCMRAQDNGFYFFKYCMENLPPEERRRIFFVIDKNSPDYPRVAPYRDNVLEFMSFKYFLYCLGAEMLVGSETKIHLSPQRSRPSYTKHKLKSTMTFFLQHGVMAFKRTDKRMGATGWHPSNYFLVSSEAEQDVITGNFGYDAAHVPVLGQARWDALEDHRTPDAPAILLMPTWREWLGDASDEEFEKTDFYQSYQRLLNSPRLDAFLEAHNATLQVFLHPLFLDRAELFHSPSSRVQVLKPNDAPLNEIIMGCSAMVTDYSSAVWDAIYMDKPALFFQFDRALYLEKTGSYIDFETDLPGDCYFDANALIDGLEQSAEQGFEPSDQQKRVASRWYAHRDHDNCKRIYECALQIERETGR